jgi:hypothetical protein
MKALLIIALAALVATARAGAPITTSYERTVPAQDGHNRFAGSWRLVSLEETGSDGKLGKADCIGQFVFTGDGHAAVQVM